MCWKYAVTNGAKGCSLGFVSGKAVRFSCDLADGRNAGGVYNFSRSRLWESIWPKSDQVQTLLHFGILLYNKYMLEHYGMHNDESEEEPRVEYEDGKKYFSKCLRNDMPNLESRIEALKAEGWKVFTRGAVFVVMEKVEEVQKKETTH